MAFKIDPPIPLDRIPQFWDWLIEMGDAGKIKIPRKIHDEVSQGDVDVSRFSAEPAILFPAPKVWIPSESATPI